MCIRDSQKVWDKFKYTIVLNGNWFKFSQNRDLREFLLSTGDSVLVEASPYDNIWGIRLAASTPEAQEMCIRDRARRARTSSH